MIAISFLFCILAIGLSSQNSFPIPEDIPSPLFLNIPPPENYPDEMADQLVIEDTPSANQLPPLSQLSPFPDLTPPSSSPPPPTEQNMPPQDSRRQLSMSLQKEARIQEVFKKQKAFLMRQFISAEEAAEVDMRAFPVPPPEPQPKKEPPAKKEPPPPPPKKEPSFTEGMVYIPPELNPDFTESRGFFISAKPVTNEEYLLFIKATNYRPPLHWPGGRIPEGFENSSVVNVSYHDVLTYAIWSGKRLPTQKEREQAERVLEFYPHDNTISNEWTSTSYSKNESGEAPKHRAVFNPKSSLKNRYKAVSNHKGIIPMHTEEFNCRTGFRLIVDAN